MGDDKDLCGRVSEGWLIWPGAEPIPMCAHHKEPPIALAAHMGWSVLFSVGNAGPCQSQDPHPEDKEGG